MVRRRCGSFAPHSALLILHYAVAIDARFILFSSTISVTTALMTPAGISIRSTSSSELIPQHMMQRKQKGKMKLEQFDNESDDEVFGKSIMNANEDLALILHEQPRTRSTQLNAKKTPVEENITTSTSLVEILQLVFPLLLVYISNQWSRYSISYLVDFSNTADNTYKAMNLDLHFSESQYGLLASTAFTVLFALSSLIAGNLADKYDRKILTLTSCLVWTVATFVQSSAHSYEIVLASRVIMGGACAFVTPVAYALIADKISKEKAALANSIYSSGVYLGGALASLSLLLDETLGWRGALGVISAFGAISVVVSGVLLPSDEDRVKISQDKAKEKDELSLVQSALQILSIPRVRYLYLASFLRFSSGLMLGVWAAPYYKQAFPDNASQYAVVNAFIVGAIGMSSNILGGYIADYLVKWIENSKQTTESSNGMLSFMNNYFDGISIRLLLPIIGSILAIPAWYFTTHSSLYEKGFETAMFWLATEYLVAESWFGPTIAVLQSTVGPSRRGTAQGLFVLTGAFGNIAPTALGLIYGNQVLNLSTDSTSSEALADLLVWGVCVGYLLSSIVFVASVASSGEYKEINAREK